MTLYQKIWLLWLLIGIGPMPVSWGQSLTSVTPVPDELKQGVSLDLGGNTPLIGFSYHRVLVPFATPRHPNAGSINMQLGVGYIPTFCLFGYNQGGLSSHHALLFRWGRRLQGEVGYAGLLAPKNAIASQVYLPGALTGLRYNPKAWFARLYLAGLFHHEDKTIITTAGELVDQRVNYLILSVGLSIGKRF